MDRLLFAMEAPEGSCRASTTGVVIANSRNAGAWRFGEAPLPA